MNLTSKEPQILVEGGQIAQIVTVITMLGNLRPNIIASCYNLMMSDL